MPLYDIPLTGNSKRSISLSEVDAVIGNPPYIRQEGMNSDDKSSYVELFRSEWPGQNDIVQALRYLRLLLHSRRSLAQARRIPRLRHQHWLAGYRIRLQASGVFSAQFQNCCGY